jgi:hypothetical protein
VVLEARAEQAEPVVREGPAVQAEPEALVVREARAMVATDRRWSPMP